LVRERRAGHQPDIRPVTADGELTDNAVAGYVAKYATTLGALRNARAEHVRASARRGKYVDRNNITVTEYLNDWIDSHAMEIKPRTLPGKGLLRGRGLHVWL